MSPSPALQRCCFHDPFHWQHDTRASASAAAMAEASVPVAGGAEGTAGPPDTGNVLAALLSDTSRCRYR